MNAHEIESPSNPSLELQTKLEKRGGTDEFENRSYHKIW